MVATALFVSFLLTLTLGVNAQGFQVHGSRQSPPQGFVQSGEAPADHQIKLRIALRQNDSTGLINALYTVSNPDNLFCGKHLTKDEVTKYVAPHQDSVNLVNAWLNGAGLRPQRLSHSGDWLTITVPISKANELLDAKYNVYTEQASGKQLVRTLSYSVPSNLQDHIISIHPTHSLSRHRPRKDASVASAPLFAARDLSQIRRAANDSKSQPAAITPKILQNLYKIPTTKATQSSNRLGVTGFIEQHVNEKDLTLFLNATRPDISSSTTFTLQTLDDGDNPQTRNETGIEANLDIQYTIGIATGVPVEFVSVGEDFHDGDLEGFLDVVNFFLAQDSPPQVITTSYGQNEDTISRPLAETLCNAFAQLGARGVSILFSSGDGAVTGSQDSNCTAFIPTFPSGCPFVTSVGATQLVNDAYEVAANFSSGGFSNYFDIPDFQATAVSSYLHHVGDLDAGMFNKTGRAYPDVSALGVNFGIIVNGTASLVSGTSASTPTFASVISLLNDRRVAAGKSPLGFLNPWLYSTGKWALTDVTKGNNPGCGTQGFPSKAGWDPVTGLGTPNFDKLLTAIGL